MCSDKVVLSSSKIFQLLQNASSTHKNLNVAAFSIVALSYAQIKFGRNLRSAIGQEKRFVPRTKDVNRDAITCSCLIRVTTVKQNTRSYSSSANPEKNQLRATFVKRSVERMAAAKSFGNQKDPMPQNFDFFLVLDFEATCDNERRISPQEIIEFPVLKVNARTHAVDSTFHQYVRPLFNPNLTPFCTELTGIVQDMVDNQKCFPEVMKDFNKWMEAEGLLDPNIKSIFVTCGDWDLKSMLPRQFETSRLHSTSYFNQWINVKKSYADVTGTFPKGMMPMLTGLRLQHVGRHHSGIDDCRNIANVVVELMRQGYVFRENGRLR